MTKRSFKSVWVPSLAALPLLALATWQISTPSVIIPDIAGRASANLSAAGAVWAKLQFDGRDAFLSGAAPSAEALDTALRVVSETYGVRLVHQDISIAPPTPLPDSVDITPPTSENLLARTATPELTGSWPENIAKTLSVTLAGRLYQLGTDKELVSSNGIWKLVPSVPLKDGTYEVSAEVSDGAGMTVQAVTPATLIVDTTPPLAPEIDLIALNDGIVTLEGKWNKDDATSLSVSAGNKEWVLGRDRELVADANGNWTLKAPIDLVPGLYDVGARVADQAGNITQTARAAALVIPEPEQAIAPVPAPLPPAQEEPDPALATTPPPPVAVEPPQSGPATSCRTAVMSLARTEFVQFDSGRSHPLPSGIALLTQMASLLQDPECKDLTIAVSGYADNVGQHDANLFLSTKRTRWVIDWLVKAGIQADRFHAASYGSNHPIDGAETEEARARNRRVEFAIKE